MLGLFLISIKKLIIIIRNISKVAHVHFFQNEAETNIYTKID